MRSNVIRVCLEGTKGAGKTTTINLLRKHFAEKGWGIGVCAPFRFADQYSLDHGHDGSIAMRKASCQDNREIVDLTLKHIRQAQISLTQKFNHAGCKPAVLIFDRHWITMQTYLFAGAWWAAACKEKDRHAQASIGGIWGNILKTAPPTFFIHCTPETSVERGRGTAKALTGLKTPEELTASYERRLKLLQQHQDIVVGQFDTTTCDQNTVFTGIADYIESQDLR